MEFASGSDALSYFEDRIGYYVPENLTVENGILAVMIKDNQVNLSAKTLFMIKTMNGLNGMWKISGENWIFSKNKRVEGEWLRWL